MTSAEPGAACLPQVSLSLKRLRLRRQMIQLFGVDERVALLANECPGRELASTAPAVSNQFGSDRGHSSRYYARQPALTPAGGPGEDRKGPSIAGSFCPVICQAMRIPMNRMNSPIAPCRGSASSKNGEASPRTAKVTNVLPTFAAGLAGAVV